MKTLTLIKKKFKCSYCKSNEELSVGYTDGIVELCVEHALSELHTVQPVPTTLEKYLERIAPKEKQ